MRTNIRRPKKTPRFFGSIAPFRTERQTYGARTSRSGRLVRDRDANRSEQVACVCHEFVGRRRTGGGDSTALSVRARRYQKKMRFRTAISRRRRMQLRGCVRAARVQKSVEF
jgi:hypothetical protein